MSMGRLGLKAKVCLEEIFFKKMRIHITDPHSCEYIVSVANGLSLQRNLII